VQTGTTVPHISGSQIKAFEFVLPSLENQEGAASLLGSIDDKIELNRRMAETLEAMAQALFKSWFVDFDPARAKAEGRSPGLPNEIAELFPDRFGEDGLPIGWQITPISELFEVVGGNTPRTDEVSYWDGPHEWATPKDLSNLYAPVLLRTERTLSDAGLGQSNSGLVPRGSFPCFSRQGHRSVTWPLPISQPQSIRA
jgi:type I restriction enzyme, S subunit